MKVFSFWYSSGVGFGYVVDYVEYIDDINHAYDIDNVISVFKCIVCVDRFRREMQTMQCTIKETSIIRGLMDNVENFCSQAEGFLQMDDSDESIPLDKLKVFFCVTTN